MSKQNSQPHKRKLIRAEVTRLLKAGVDVGKRVFNSRPNDIWLRELPAVLVYYTKEIADDQNTRPVVYKKTLDLSVQVVARFEKDIEDFLDSRAFEIELILAENLFLNLDFVESIELVRTTPYSIDSESDENVESVILEFEIVYRHTARIFKTLNEFLSFINNISNAVGQKAKDIVNIRSK